ncbi:MAG TPA: hypothetical protein VFF76_00465 [Holophagaceae bacterium]|jgi:hypothetical protein|nr:hypothetical protein [Holophagaceae bacterium]
MTSPQDLEQNPEQTPRPASYFPPPGARTDYYRDPRFKSPLLAGFLSLMPGVGQVFLGYTRLGFVHGVTAATLICLMSTNRLGPLEPLVGVFVAFFWLYNLVDAYRRATLLNEAITRMETPQQLSDGFDSVSSEARIAAGGILIVAGTLALLNLRFGISMEWLERWWPAGLVLMGLYLVLRAVKDRISQANSAQG